MADNFLGPDKWSSTQSPNALTNVPIDIGSIKDKKQQSVGNKSSFTWLQQNLLETTIARRKFLNIHRLVLQSDKIQSYSTQIFNDFS